MKNLTLLIVLFTINNLFAQIVQKKDSSRYLTARETLTKLDLISSVNPLNQKVIPSTLKEKRTDSSEIRLNQNGMGSVDLIAYAILQKRVYKKFGVWSFLYWDSYYGEGEILGGPCFINKHMTLGVGYGYEFGDELPIAAVMFKASFQKYNFSGFVEISQDWYWQASELNRTIGKKNDSEIGIYNQSDLGTGIQFKKTYSERLSFNIGLGYRTSEYGFNRNRIVSKIGIGLKL